MAVANFHFTVLYVRKLGDNKLQYFKRSDSCKTLTHEDICAYPMLVLRVFLAFDGENSSDRDEYQEEEEEPRLHEGKRKARKRQS